MRSHLKSFQFQLDYHFAFQRPMSWQTCFGIFCLHQPCSLRWRPHLSFDTQKLGIYRSDLIVDVVYFMQLLSSDQFNHLFKLNLAHLGMLVQSPAEMWQPFWFRPCQSQIVSMPRSWQARPCLNRTLSCESFSCHSAECCVGEPAGDSVGEVEGTVITNTLQAGSVMTKACRTF